MPRINHKREALREALGVGARLFDDGEIMGEAVIRFPNGEKQFLVFQVDGEHDGSFAISQIGGIIPLKDVLVRSSRGTAAGRSKVK